MLIFLKFCKTDYLTTDVLPITKTTPDGIIRVSHAKSPYKGVACGEVFGKCPILISVDTFFRLLLSLPGNYDSCAGDSRHDRENGDGVSGSGRSVSALAAGGMRHPADLFIRNRL